MRARFLIAPAGLLAAALALQWILASSAAGAGSASYSIDAAAFVVHSGGTTHYSAACPADSVVPASGYENKGTTSMVGGAIASINLPGGATVTAFRLSARDFDGDFNATAYLVRKRVAGSATVDGFAGYEVMAQIATFGSDTHIRRFTDSSIIDGTIANGTYAYFAELVNCTDTVQPIAVQVTYTLP